MQNKHLNTQRRKSLGRRIKLWREQLGMTQPELGKIVFPESNPNTVQGRISRIENGDFDLGYDAISAIAEGLGITVIELLSEDAVPLKAKTFQAIPIFAWEKLASMKRTTRSHKLSVFWSVEMGAETFVLTMQNDKCLPFLKGQRIVVDPNAQVRHGDFVVASNGDAQPVVCEVLKTKNKFQFRRLDDKDHFFDKDHAATRLYGVVISHIISFR